MSSRVKRHRGATVGTFVETRSGEWKNNKNKSATYESINNNDCDNRTGLTYVVLGDTSYTMVLSYTVGEYDHLTKLSE
jgi:hypothetical protein